MCGQVSSPRTAWCMSCRYLGQPRCSSARYSSFLQNLQSALETCQWASPIWWDPWPINTRATPYSSKSSFLAWSQSRRRGGVKTTRDCCSTSSPQWLIFLFSCWLQRMSLSLLVIYAQVSARRLSLAHKGSVVSSYHHYYSYARRRRGHGLVPHRGRTWPKIESIN